MKVLLIGNGGRENAIAWKIVNSESFKKSGGRLFVTQGNPGMKEYSESVDIAPDDIKGLIEFAEEEKIELIVVGPEKPLAIGITDEFEKKGFNVFGPRKNAAEIESSKIFAKKLMQKYNIPTAPFTEFSRERIDLAGEYLKYCSYPVVFKADGLASGKGVMIADNITEGEEILREFSSGSSFKESGSNFIAEEFLEGEEVSVFAVCDGTDFIVLPFSQDHKKISDGEKGRNTGGMGAVAPVRKFMTDDLYEKIKDKIIIPVLDAMRNEGREYKGCLYCGLMIKDNEPYVIEFNCRFGDPETQAVLPLIGSDFLELLISAATNDLKNYRLEINDLNACCVVLASSGYPGKFETGKIISGTENVKDNCLIFHSATKSEYIDDREEFFTAGGRVLSVVGISEKSIEDAVRTAYENADRISFENKYFRKDIGFRIVNKNGDSVN